MNDAGQERRLRQRRLHRRSRLVDRHPHMDQIGHDPHPGRVRVVLGRALRVGI